MHGKHRLGIALLCLAALVGCADDRPGLASVSGLVTLDEKPLPNAVVIFLPTDGGRGSRGRTDDKGRYTLRYLRDIEGAIPGSHRVRIVTASEDSPVERLPAKYNAATTLKVEVAAGSNTFDFPLESR